MWPEADLFNRILAFIRYTYLSENFTRATRKTIREHDCILRWGTTRNRPAIS